MKPNRWGLFAAAIHAMFVGTFFVAYLAGKSPDSAAVIAVTIDLPVTAILGLIANIDFMANLVFPKNLTLQYLILIVFGTVFYFYVGKLIGIIVGRMFKK